MNEVLLCAAMLDVTTIEALLYAAAGLVTTGSLGFGVANRKPKKTEADWEAEKAAKTKRREEVASSVVKLISPQLDRIEKKLDALSKGDVKEANTLTTNINALVQALERSRESTEDS